MITTKGRVKDKSIIKVNKTITWRYKIRMLMVWLLVRISILLILTLWMVSSAFLASASSDKCKFYTLYEVSYHIEDVVCMLPMTSPTPYHCPGVIHKRSHPQGCRPLRRWGNPGTTTTVGCECPARGEDGEGGEREGDIYRWSRCHVMMPWQVMIYCVLIPCYDMLCLDDNTLLWCRGYIQKQRSCTECVCASGRSWPIKTLQSHLAKSYMQSRWEVLKCLMV